VSRSLALPELSVVVPAYGEGHRIGASVLALQAALGDATEIIVVDDGSPDETGAVAKEAGAEVIRLPVNRGKGAAVRTGVLAARGAMVVFTDADLSYAPPQIERVRAELERGADVVVGSRRHVGTTTLVRAGRLREISGRVFNLFTRLVLPRGFGDTQCGLKGFQREAARAIFQKSTVDGFAFDVEVLWLASHLGYTVVEVPVKLDSAAGSTVRLPREVTRMLRDLVRIKRRADMGGYG
jgi:glycosyltransferase involved in cell wall biosynthesis